MKIAFMGPEGEVFAEFDDDLAERFSPDEWRAHRYRASFYIRRRSAKHTVLAHREILGCTKGDGRVVDHIDGDTLNNRKANLRIVDAEKNAWNRASTSKTGFFGVQEVTPGRFTGKVRHRGELHYCGYFRNARDAAIAVNQKLIDLRGDFARLNNVEEQASCS